jgi:hypothetical protein
MLRPIAVCGATTVGLIVFLDRLVGILSHFAFQMLFGFSECCKIIFRPVSPKGEGERI